MGEWGQGRATGAQSARVEEVKAEQALPARTFAEEAETEERREGAKGREMRGWECGAGGRIWAWFCFKMGGTWGYLDLEEIRCQEERGLLYGEVPRGREGETPST